MSYTQESEVIQRYKVTIMLPASVTTEQALSYAQNFGEIEETETSAIVREHHDELDNWKLEWFCVNRPDEQEIERRLSLLSETAPTITPLDWQISEIKDENWLEVCYKAFEPFTIGSFFIHGSHHEGALPADKISLQIDAATAFGSGEHGTTAGCLQALDDLKTEGYAPQYILDMGTGSGILGIAAAKLWDDVPVLAPDIDEEAVIVAQRHAKLNNVSENLMDCVQSESFMNKNIQAHAPYPLIIANILAATLKEMAADLSKTLAPSGIVILSGILDTQAEAVTTLYQDYGLVLEKTYPVDEWVSLRMRKSA